MNKNFFIYGLLGWLLEVVWTGIGSLFEGNLMLASHTYLWMFPIYGLAVFLEPVHDQIEDWPWYGRGLVWAGLILMIEYTTGWFLRSVLGECPWDYSTSTTYHLQGLIRFDYFPVWFVVGLLFERIHRALDQYYLRP